MAALQFQTMSLTLFYSLFQLLQSLLFNIREKASVSYTIFPPKKNGTKPLNAFLNNYYTNYHWCSNACSYIRLSNVFGVSTPYTQIRFLEEEIMCNLMYRLSNSGTPQQHQFQWFSSVKIAIVVKLALYTCSKKKLYTFKS